jgi:hypothetical protein
MKVKIGNKIYNEEDEPILVIFDMQDKGFIKDMPKNAYKYCSYPDTTSDDEAKEFMKDKDK